MVRQTWPTHAASLRGALIAENLREFERRRDLELIVSAVGGPLVLAPAQELRRVPKPVALQMVVLHLADALEAQRFPGEILAGRPAARATRHPRPRLGARLCP